MLRGLFGKKETSLETLKAEAKNTQAQMEANNVLKRAEALRVLENNAAALADLSTDPEQTAKLVAGVIYAAAEFPGIYHGNIWTLRSFVEHVMGIPRHIRLTTRNQGQDQTH